MANTEPEPKHEHKEEEEAPTNEGEDTRAQDAPIVKFKEIAITTNEEDEASILRSFTNSIAPIVKLRLLRLFTNSIKMGTNGKRKALVLSSFSSTKRKNEIKESTRDKREKKLIK